jgi:hypothetical protein
MITGTYKEEYVTGDHGWHVERGAPPKILGGRILELSITRPYAKKDEYRTMIKKIESIMFPI